MLRRTILIFLILSSLPVVAGELVATNAWIQNLAPVVPVRAGYMKLTNTGQQELKIVSVESEKFSLIEIHKSTENNGMISMQAVNLLSIKAGETLELKPGGVHLMMMNPLQALSTGEQIAVTLTLDDESTLTVLMEVRK